ncbi:MAG: hypothetical protein H0W86_10855 [Armatimonadetes bacterium]|nr:hypothetical protein [Armatimonadota bacterium]
MDNDALAHKPHTKNERQGRWPWAEVFDDHLARGEYYKAEPGGVDVARRDARQRFLTALKKAAPNVLQELQDDVFPEFCRLRGELATERCLTVEEMRLDDRDIVCEEYVPAPLGEKERSRTKKALDRLLNSATPKENQEVELRGTTREDWEREKVLRSGIRKLLRSWGKKFGIDYDWVYDEAIFTMTTYADRMMEDPDKRWTDEFAPHWGGRRNMWGVPLTAEDIEFRFELKTGWEPTCERWADFRKRALREFLSFVKSYGREIRRKVEAHGYVRAPTVREPDHFVWLVEVVVLRRSWQQIATKYDRDKSSVIEAVKRAAELVDISISRLRADRRQSSVLAKP